MQHLQLNIVDKDRIIGTMEQGLFGTLAFGIH